MKSDNDYKFDWVLVSVIADILAWVFEEVVKLLLSVSFGWERDMVIGSLG